MKLATLLRTTSILAALTFSASCDLSPDLQKPDIEVPASFKEVSAEDTSPITDGSWALAHPEAAAQFAKGEWWKIFDDKTLDALIDAAHKNSPTLEAARERLNQARALTSVADSNLYPDISLGLGATRQKQSPANPFIPPGTQLKPYNLFDAKASIDYGLDIFGRARNNAFAALMREEESEQTYRAAKITLEADVAEAYYTLRSLRAEEKLLEDTLKLRNETLGLTRKRYEIGDISDLDVARSEGESATTKSELLGVQQQRAVTEHALAILTGATPESFTIDTTEILDAPPSVPAGMPSTLLERRPDIVSAEKEMAATNAEIGLARAAFFPSIDLSASGGFQSAVLGDIFKWSSRTWLLGPLSGTELTVPLFTGGRNDANLALAKAGFRESVANYRSKVLVAFKETEDALSGVRTAKGQVAAQDEAASSATRAYKIAKLQYDNGFIGYLDSIDAQRTQLSAQRGQVQSRGNQYVATITLIRALGGGWDMPVSEAPKAAPVKEEAIPEVEAAPKAEAPAKVEIPVEDTQAQPSLKRKAAPKAVMDAPAPQSAPAPEDSSQPVPADANVQWQPLSDTKARPAPQPVPFKKRHPNKPAPGLDDVPPPAQQDLDMQNAPENTILRDSGGRV